MVHFSGFYLRVVASFAFVSRASSSPSRLNNFENVFRQDTIKTFRRGLIVDTSRNFNKGERTNEQSILHDHLLAKENGRQILLQRRRRRRHLLLASDRHHHRFRPSRETYDDDVNE